ncbi:Rieske (2Fe-2S) protein [Hymenobacter nivis]|uniref:(2Fe-2S)-binding protein n=1 Tax=Hymenobacter nivis TaxID=1850093 RepID=A0A2Z3GDU5_9BACT|nr:Rieske (2Fe-2S) protein [Hymenobacter nivis]AWM31779.1 (2Fe-2S)-binding protein [Hymenobacter nivis]
MPDPAGMNRQNFLQLFGLGAAGLLASACLSGCSSAGSDPAPTAATGVDFAVDLTAVTSTPLNDAGVGYIYGANRAVIVAKTTAGTYVAFQAPCPHQGTSVYFDQAAAHFICPNHNAVFNLSGGIISGPVSSGLKQYAVVQTGTSLHVTG